MILRTLAIAAALSTIAGAALAEGRAEAELQQPVPSATKFIAGDAAWSCLGKVCAAYPATEAVQSVSVCKAVVKNAGAPLAAYSFDGKAFPPDLLARCNGK